MDWTYDSTLYYKYVHLIGGAWREMVTGGPTELLWYDGVESTFEGR
jgi:hypothetical protein